MLDVHHVICDDSLSPPFLFFYIIIPELALKRRRMFVEWDDTPDLIEADEVQRYLQAHFTVDQCQDDTVLQFWKDQRFTFPFLSMLARSVLCVPASSASSERAFSSAGRVLEARRNRLNPGTVDSILFLHSAARSQT